MENLYKAPESELLNANDQDQYEFGGFWVRLLASVIDSILIMILTFSLGMLVYGVVYFESTEFVQGYWDFVISYVLPFVITILFWVYRSATPGKMALGLKIVDAETFGKVPVGRLVVRYVGYFISLLFLGLGYLWVVWDKRKQSWHDKMAGTLVVKIK